VSKQPASFFALMALKIGEAELPFLAFALTERGARVNQDGGMPLNIAPQHRDLPRWSACNDPR
jgi:hypothetical protein